MRRLMSVLLTALLFSANRFAGANENSATAKLTRKVPQNALFDLLVGTWDVSYEVIDKDGKIRHDGGQVRYWMLEGNAPANVVPSDSAVVRLDISRDEGKTCRPGGVSYLQRQRN